MNDGMTDERREELWSKAKRDGDNWLEECLEEIDRQHKELVALLAEKSALTGRVVEQMPLKVVWNGRYDLAATGEGAGRCVDRRDDNRKARELLAVSLGYLENHEDAGPAFAGYKSDELTDHIRQCRTLLDGDK